ncbi:MAG: hypothetical protein HFI88_11410 [Lachnospiraceae bacterium]|nr:hypothetical protein [Lachnospiraceae bacterium]
MRVHIDVYLTEEQHNSLIAALEENIKRIRMNVQDCRELVQGPDDNVGQRLVGYWEEKEKVALQTMGIFRGCGDPERGRNEKV